MARFKDWDWNLITTADGRSAASWDQAQLAILMDIRDQLRTLNALLRCPNFLNIPTSLRQIERNTKRKKKRTPALKRVA